MFTKPPGFELKSLFLILVLFCSRAESKCRGCDLALASYKTYDGANLSVIAQYFGTSVERIQSFNPNVTQKDIKIGTKINVPFSCDCVELDGQQFLGHMFSYQVISHDTYDKVAEKYYANLCTAKWVRRFNIYDEAHIPDVNVQLNVTVNCSCGDKKVDKGFGLFVTYPLQPGENLSSIANESGVPQELLQRYNPDKNFSSGSGLVFIPGRDQSGNFPPFHFTAGISRMVIAGISVAGVAGALFLAFCIYVGLYRRKKVEKVEEGFLQEGPSDHYVQHERGAGNKSSGSAALVAFPQITGMIVDKSVEFKYEELAKATDDFSEHNKIGQGGFASVYYAELRGEKVAIKKMDKKASKEFLAELKILTRIHHVNVVRLVGYCVAGSLFLVYEFIENGTLSQHLHGSGKDPLSWSRRVKIALDSARGLEYIHEHTVPVYIHRDVKSSNILIDKSFCGKVADFGLAKLTDQSGSASWQSHPMGTFGYMPPEYVRFGEVSRKTDVYAFGVVLYEIISAQQAIIKINEVVTELTGIVALFQNLLNLPNPREELRKLIDPRLGDDYPFDSVYEMARLARACTQHRSQLRPNMRQVVVALTSLSSSTDNWDAAKLYESQDLVKLMSRR